MSFLVDTGASISILPHSKLISHLICPTAVKLTSATGVNVKTHGEVDVTLGIRRTGRTFRWTFVVAAVTEPLLGLDFCVKIN